MFITYLPKVIKIPRASWYRAKKVPWDLEKKHTKEVIKVHEVKLSSCSKKGKLVAELCGVYHAFIVHEQPSQYKQGVSKVQQCSGTL